MQGVYRDSSVSSVVVVVYVNKHDYIKDEKRATFNQYFLQETHNLGSCYRCCCECCSGL